MTKKIALVSVVSPMYDVPNFNLGLAELAGYLRHRNPELCGKNRIIFIEPDIELSRSPELENSVQWTLNKLRKHRPDIIGLSAKLGSHNNLRELLNNIVNFDWRPKIVVGNVVSTFAHDYLVQYYRNVMFCLGDGELTMDAIYNDNSLVNIPNLVINMDGMIIKTERSVLDASKQFWLPAFDMLKTAIKHGASITIRATTGCSNHCTFCSIPHTAIDCNGKKAGWRAYPVMRTIRTLIYLEKQGVKRVGFVDDELGCADWNFLSDLGDQLCLFKNTIKFSVSLRCDTLYDNRIPYIALFTRQAILKRLKAGGMESIFLGAESGSDTQLKRYGKGITSEIIENALEFALETGFKVHLGWIPIDPLMTVKELRDNIAFLKKEIHGHYVYDLVSSPFTTMRVQKNTSYAKMVEKKGFLGELQSNMSFYYCFMNDPKIQLISDMTKTWFEAVIDTRYAFRQLHRFNPDITKDLMNQMHALDITLVEGLLNNNDYYGVCDFWREMLLIRRDIITKMKVILDGYYSKNKTLNFFQKLLKLAKTFADKK